MLAILFAGDELRSVDEATVMPTDKLGAGEGLAKELFGPVDALLERVGDGAVRTRHGVGDHSEGGVAIDERFVDAARPAIESRLLHFVFGVHLVHDDVGVLGSDR